jgi:hypothetical protein
MKAKEKYPYRITILNMTNIYKLLKTITGLIEKRKRNITNNGKKKIMSGFLPEEERNMLSHIPRNLNPRKLPSLPSLPSNPSPNRFSMTRPRFLSRSKKLLFLSPGIRWIS